LGALTESLPKPLLSVGGRPFLSFLIDALARQGFNDILLLAGYQGPLVAEFAQHYTRPNLSVRCLVEDEPLGTGGALRHAESYLADQFVLLNGDTVFDINLNDLVTPPLDKAVARIALRRVSDTSRFGRVVLDCDKVLAMREKGFSGEGLINGGIYFLARAAMELQPAGGSSLERDLFPRLIAVGHLEGREYSGFFLDIGIPADFEAAQSLVPANLRRPAVFLDRDGVLNEDANYVSLPEEFRWIEGAKAAVKQLNDAGYYVFVVTNQAGVARGYCDLDRVNALHGWMQEELRSVGAHVDAFYLCPHHPDFTGPCDCRKPEPGMIFQAMAEWPIIKERSFLIGDKVWDLESAERAGIKGFLYSGGSLRDTLKFIESAMQSPANPHEH
jgi:D-glycero-D-manno-heptose 1,7-bisphosphate phosphatase